AETPAPATPASSRRRRRSAPSSWQLDTNGRPAARSALDPDLARVIRDDRLDDREAEPGPVLLGRVVRSEQALALFGGQPVAAIADVEPHAAFRLLRSDRQLAARGHRVDRVEQEVLDGTLQLIGIGANRDDGRIEI